MSNFDVLNTFIMGSISGAASSLLFQPLDVTKTRFQNISKQRCGQKISYVYVLTLIYRNDGIIGFWSGLSPALMRSVTGVGMYFSVLQVLNDHLVTDKPTISQTIFIGAAARSSGIILLMPFSVLKTRFESGQYNYNGLFQAVNEIRRQEGSLGLIRGLVPTLIRDVPFSGMYYLFYTRFKTAIGFENAENKTSAKVFLCAVCASCLASIVTHPADVLKTYTQLYPAEFSHLSSGLTFVYHKFGLSGYFKGLGVRLIRRTLVTSMSWTVYERIREWMRMKF